MENEKNFLRSLMAFPPSGRKQLAWDSQLRAPSQLLRVKLLSELGWEDTIFCIGIEIIEYRKYKAFVETPMYIISGWMFVAGTKST